MLKHLITFVSLFLQLKSMSSVKEVPIPPFNNSLLTPAKSKSTFTGIKIIYFYFNH